MWLQLLERLAKVSSCQPAVVRGLALQLAEQQEVVSNLQPPRAGQQQVHMQVIGRLQQQISQQGAEMAELRGQLAELRGQQPAESAELRGQVAELRGQVAQLMQALQHRNVGTGAML